MPSDDRGQTTVMIIGFAVVVLLMVTVVISSSQAFLARRSLHSWADGAAVVAAQSFDEAGLYDGRRDGPNLPLSESAARAAVVGYVAANDLPGRFPGLQVTQVSVDAQGAVTVGLAARIPVPFVNTVTGGYGDGVAITARSTARGPLS